ncbi:MAG TPA: hypothetical protein VN516_04985, partial [Candidatus Baltobacteraceae bacterium]|nr:hypothetical protein [Candidatus Baltobacteraceae bacterium]
MHNELLFYDCPQSKESSEVSQPFLAISIAKIGAFARPPSIRLLPGQNKTAEIVADRQSMLQLLNQIIVCVQ